MSVDAKDVVGRVYAAVSSGDFETLSGLMADDVVEHEEIPGLEPNKEGVLAFFRGMRQSFPDVSMTVEDMIAEGEKVAVRFTLSGTHRGEFMGMPATGNEITVPGIDFFRVRDGQIAEHWGVSDMAAMMEQLGGGTGP